MARRTLTLAAAVLAVTAPAALAQLPPPGMTGAPPPSLHNIPWYSAHPAERAAVLRFCHSDHRYDNTPDCANAESADTADYAARMRRAAEAAGAFKRHTDPAWWLANPYARWNAIGACSVTPDPGFTAQYTAAECAAARQADAMAPPRLRAHAPPWLDR